MAGRKRQQLKRCGEVSLFRKTLYCTCTTAIPAPSLGGEKAKEPHLVGKENETRGDTVNSKLVSARLVLCADTLPTHPFPFRERLKLNPASLPSPGLFMLPPAVSVGVASKCCCHSSRDSAPLQPFCSLSLQRVSHKVMLMLPGAETSPLSLFPVPPLGRDAH